MTALWLVTVGSRSRSRPITSQRIDDRPCPSIQANGIEGVRDGQAWIEEADSDPVAGLSWREARDIANEVARAGAAARREAGA